MYIHSCSYMYIKVYACIYIYMYVAKNGFCQLCKKLMY